MAEIEIAWEPVVFIHHTKPAGRVPNTKEGHCLWYYYILASKNLQKLGDDIVFEGDDDPIYNFLELYLKLCRAYGTDPETTTNLWPAVEEEIDRLNDERTAEAWRSGNRSELSLYGKLPERYKLTRNIGQGREN